MHDLSALHGILEEKLLQQMHQLAFHHTHKEGDIILDIDQSIKSIPIVLKGSIKVSRVDEEGREIFLYFIGPNETCAMTFTCCMQQYPSEIRAIAEEAVEWISIPVQYMDQWLVQFPTWKSFVMRTIRQRFRELLDTIDQMAFQQLDDRLIHYLGEISKASSSTIINRSHEEIATDLASSRVVISRLLKKLEIDKKIILYRGQIKLLSAFFQNNS